jgi:hypothetical protein
MSKLLPIQDMPNWLTDINKDSEFNIKQLLDKSIYYPASNTDGRVFEALAGSGYSFVYVDPNISNTDLKQQLNLVAGYDVILSREINKDQLCFNPYNPVLPIPLVDEDPNKIMLSKKITPYAHWAVFQRRAHTDPGHGPERFSLLFIAGEGVATYQAIYFSNRCRPMGIVLKGHSGFAGNWTRFEKQNGIFERTVMANPAGFPDYLFVDHIYDNDWSSSDRSYWHNYSTMIKELPRKNFKIYKAKILFPSQLREN